MKHVYLFLIAITLVAFLFRVTAVDTLPPGLYIDEVSNGLNASLILTDGVDEHGSPYPLWFKAFGEYKMPVMIYLISGTMSFMGKTDSAVRLPSVIAGTLTVPLLFGIVYLALRDAKEKHLKMLPFVASGLLAVTPWHLHFSRAGFEATIALFFTMLSVLLYFCFLQKKQFQWLFFSCIALALTMYTYNAYRFIAVIIFSSFIIYAVLNLKKVRNILLLHSLFFLLLILPVIFFSLSPEGSERFSQTSSFLSYTNKSFGEKMQLIPMDFMNNYLRYFSLEFLFAVGDQNGRHQVPGMGLLYRWESIFLIIGIFVLFMGTRNLLSYFILLMLFVSPIPAAVTIPSPHALRSLLMVIPLTLVVSLGLLMAISYLRRLPKAMRYSAISFVFLLFVFEGMYYTHLYTTHYPKVNVLDWGGAYKETVSRAAAYTAYDYVLIDSNMGVMAPYVSFYDGNMQFRIIPPGGSVPEDLKGKKLLLIRPDYKESGTLNRLESIRLTNVNRDIFAEIYSL